MHVREIGLPVDGRADIDRWKGLAERAVEPNPFFEASFATAAARHLGHPEPTLLVVEDDDTWLACLPVTPTRVASVLPAWRNWCHLYCFLGIPLIDSRAAASAARTLLEHATAHAPGRQLILERITRDGPAANALTQAATALGLVVTERDSHERALVSRRAGGGYTDHIRGHHRREMARLGRRLETELGPVVVSDRAGSQKAVDRFVELERAGWKGRATTALGNSPGHTQLFRDVCSAYAAEDRLELLELSAGGRAVAMKCNLIAGDGGFCFKIAYDERLGRFSPGVQLEWQNLTLFHERQRVEWQDSCADPDNEMINHLWPGRRTIATTVMARRGVPGALSRQAVRATRAAHAVRRSR